MSEWKTIETAPKDGTYMLLGSAEDGGSWVGKFEPQYQWRADNPWSSMMLNCEHLPIRYASLKPTHWMPLPSAPPPLEARAVGGRDGI